MVSYQPAYEELLRACDEVGRDPASIWLTAGADVDFPDDPADFEAEYPQPYYPEFPIRPLGPTPADAVEQLRPLVELGVQPLHDLPQLLAHARTLQRRGGAGSGPDPIPSRGQELCLRRLSIRSVEMQPIFQHIGGLSERDERSVVRFGRD